MREIVEMKFRRIIPVGWHTHAPHTHTQRLNNTAATAANHTHIIAATLPLQR